MDAQERKFERVGRLVYGFHRWTNPERLREPQSLPPDLAVRAAELVRRYDGVLARFQEGDEGAVDDQEIAALLADAEAFARALPAAGAE